MRKNLHRVSKTGRGRDRLLHPLKRLIGAAETPSPLPAGIRVYAIGDVHGCSLLLDRLIETILADGATAPDRRIIVYLGDFVDRGPDSKGVIERLLAPPPAGFEVQHVRGNHDQSLLDFLEEPSTYHLWQSYGAEQTLMSYGVWPPPFDDPVAIGKARDEFAKALPADHLQFFRRLPLFIRIGNYYFAHAGARPGVPLGRQMPEDLMWIRDEFLKSNYDFGAVIVHGHTPTNSPVRRANRIGVDTGAFASGRLTCAVLEGDSCRFLQT